MGSSLKKAIPAKFPENTQITVKKDWDRTKPLHIPEQVKDPNYEYRWIEKTNDFKLSYEDWQIVKKAEIKYGNYMDDPDGKVEYKELYLCKIPKQIAESKKKAIEEKAQRKVQNLKMNHASAIEKAGGINAVSDMDVIESEFGAEKWV